MEIKERFRLLSAHFVSIISSLWAFLFFFILVGILSVFGYHNGFTEKWLAQVHMGFSIITFFMVLLIQHTEYRDTRSMQLKLDELVKAVEGANNELINAQKKPDQFLDKLQTATEQY